MDNQTLLSLSAMIKSEGFDHFGFAALSPSPSFDRYESWIEQGHHGEMDYLKTHLPHKKHPESYFKGLHSAIVITKPYFPNSDELKSPLRVAQYAKSKDYHQVFKAELEGVAQKLKIQFPQQEFLCFTDSGPILERDLAARAGLGWVGKNTCLIDRTRGSLFFIGEILTSIPMKNQSAMVQDFCGTCNRCVEICPTQAIKPNRVLEAKDCIAYLNIESKTAPPGDLRAKISDWFFGCDLCQTVCPWNEKAHGKDLMRALSKSSSEEKDIESLKQELQMILKASNKELMRLYQDFPLSRARGFGLKRNALLVIHNLNLQDLSSEVEQTARLWPRLKELCEWVLEGFAQP